MFNLWPTMVGWHRKFLRHRCSKIASALISSLFLFFLSCSATLEKTWMHFYVHITTPMCCLPWKVTCIVVYIGTDWACWIIFPFTINENFTLSGLQLNLGEMTNIMYSTNSSVTLWANMSSKLWCCISPTGNCN